MENKFNHREAAALKASEANQAALKGRQHRSQYRIDKSTLDAWAGIMSSSHPVSATTIAFILALLNMLAGWEMNRDLIDQAGVFNAFGWDKLPFWAPLIIALPLEALAFWVASWLGKAYTEEIFELTVWNRMHLIHNGDYHRPLAIEEERKSQKRSRFWFWLLLILVITVQGGISWHRIQLLDGDVVSALLAVFAFVFIVGEIVAGVYADYLLKRWQYSRAYKRNLKAFGHQTITCANADRMVVELLEKGHLNNEETTFLNGDMKHSVYRNKYRAQDDERYVDEVSLKHIAVEVRTEDEMPVSNARVIGSLPGGSSTNAAYTNSKGIVAVYWEGNDDSLERIKINGVEYIGPFGKDMVHQLHLPLAHSNQTLALNN